MKKRISMVIGAALFLTATVQTGAMDEEIKQVYEKYKDAFEHQEKLSENAYFVDKLKKIQEKHDKSLEELRKKHKTSHVYIKQQEDAIRKKYHRAFEKEEAMRNNPQYQVEIEKLHAQDVTTDDIDRAYKSHEIDKKYNPYYDELQKAEQKIKKVRDKFIARKNSESYQKELQVIKDRLATERNKLFGKYDPELKKAFQEIEAITKKYLRPKESLSRKAS